jgi:Ca2+-transporting ATPase
MKSMDEFELPELKPGSSLDLLLTQHLDPENPFAFSLEQMVSIVDKKQLAFLRRVGGVDTIARGLHSNTVTGLNWDEDCLSYVRLYDLLKKEEPDNDDEEQHFPLSMTDCETFIQRRKVYGANILPQVEKVSLLQLMWEAFQDKTLVKKKNTQLKYGLMYTNFFFV